MNLFHGFVEQMTDQIGWGLIHSVWQGTLVALVLAVLLRLLRRSSASVRYALCLASLFGVVLFVMLTALWSHSPSAGAAPIIPRVRSELTASRPPPAVASIPIRRDAQTFWAVEQVMHWLVGAWFFGIIALSCWQFGGWLALGRYRRVAQPAGEPWQSRLADLAKRMRVTRAAMSITKRIDVPTVVGTIRPVILMPLAVLNSLSVQQVEAILTHELAHIRRYDYLVNLLQAAIETLLFYHPAIWWISRQIRLEREHCCDELAAIACGDRSLYAGALMALEQIRDVRLAPAAGGGGRGELLNRVRRVLGVNTPSASRGNAWLLAIVLVLVVFGTVFSSQQLRAQPRSSTRPTTRPQVSQIQPEDLVAPPPTDYAIGPNDLVKIMFEGLVGEGIESVKQSRVTQTGFLSLPIIGDISAKGKSATQLERAILGAYKDKQIKDIKVSIAVVEARNRVFSIYGAVNRIGQYAMVKDEFRLFDALALAQGVTSQENIQIIRRMGGDGDIERIIEIPAAAVAASDPKVNVVIHHNDMIVVAVSPEGRRKASPPTMPTSEPASDAIGMAHSEVAIARKYFRDMQNRLAGGELYTPQNVQLLLDASERLAIARIEAAGRTAETELKAAEEHLQRCKELSDILFKRRTAEVTRVQLSQANAALESARGQVIRARARLQDEERLHPSTSPSIAPNDSDPK